MKTVEQIKAEMEQKLAAFEAEMQKLQKEHDDLVSGKLPDILENFDPYNIYKVLKFLEKKENENFFTYSGGYFDGDYFVCEQDKEISFGRYTIKIVDQEGGGEGSGEHWHSVFKVSEKGKEDRYYYIPGWYQSYNGTEIEWSGIYEVEPYDKVVIAWRKK